MPYNPKKLEEKWQKKWAKENVFQSKEGNKKKYYVLEMFPYPSGKLHMGHVRNYSIGDTIARYMRMKGHNVLYPMGYDAFGLPAENAAIKGNSSPKDWTFSRIEEMQHQQKQLGFSYDWEREIATCTSEYYKWNQWIFLKFLEKGLAYRGQEEVNWCPKCKTVLANEQVHGGKCWRCNSEVELKELEQWFFNITKYADELLNGLEKLDKWPARVKAMQKNWIGRSKGIEIEFGIKDSNEKLPVFTTRPDTIFGVTFMAIAPEHPLLEKLVKGKDEWDDLQRFKAEVARKTDIERTAEGKEKHGVFTGLYAINPVNKEVVPVFAADFVLMDYGTGAVMAVPAHDQRDFEFAKKYSIQVKPVIMPKKNKLNGAEMQEAFVEEGVLANSGKFDSLNSRKAIDKISDWIEKEKFGQRKINFRLKNWLISRQRFWGTPIPIVYCEKCGIVPVPEKDLPILLPEKADFKIGGNPLTSVKEFVNTICPKCGAKARRETDTMDTFVDSSWYFLRFCSPKEKNKAFDKKAVSYWMPVDQYIGGIEHATMHLIYARFFCKALRDIGLLDFDEPFTRLLAQGMVLKDGAKMSKSLGNTVDPGEIIEKFGTDTARLFMLSSALPEKEFEWSDKGVESSYRFVSRVFDLVEKNSKNISFEKIPKKLSQQDRLMLSKANRAVRDVEKFMTEFKFNFAVSSISSLVSGTAKYLDGDYSKNVAGDAVKKIILLLASFAPYSSEELWEIIGMKAFVSLADFPKFDKNLIDEDAERAQDFVDNVRKDIIEIKRLAEIENPKKISIFIAPKWKNTVVEKALALIEENPSSNLIKELMAVDAVKKQGKKAVSFIQSVSKKANELRGFKSVEEEKIMETAKEAIEKEFSAVIEIIPAEKSSESKAGSAFPLKPAILIE